MAKKVQLDPTWQGRRRIVRLSLLSCLGLALYSMWLGPEMAAVVVPSVAALAAGVIGSYVFGAAWERSSGVASQNRYEDYSYTRITEREDVNVGI